MTIITLTSDFGLKDGFVGTMKGVLWSICPAAQLADISHEIPPQNILEGAWVVYRACSFFPSGTVHLAVVDPGVGTTRRAVAARLGDHYFVGPDNGLFTPVLEAVERQSGRVEFVQLANSKYWLPEVSQTFHGRDIFAPAAAHLAKGVPLEELGPALTDPVRLKLPKPEKTENGWRAHIVEIDHFGNLSTDLPGSAISTPARVRLRLHGREIRGLVQSFGQRPRGELIALVNSAGFLELAIVNGNAAFSLDTSVGDLVEVTIF